MKNMLIVVALAFPVLANASNAEACGTMAEAAYFQTQSSLTVKESVAIWAGSQKKKGMKPDKGSKIFGLVLTDVLTKAKYVWKGLPEDEVKRLAFLDCQIGAMKHGVY